MKTRIFKSILIVLSIFIFSIKSIFADTEQNRTLLNDGWQLFSSENTHTDGAIISSDGFDSKYGYPIMLPSTVMNGLIQNNRFPDIFEPFVLENMSKEPYEVPWWYRKEFHLNQLTSNDFYQITFEGINYKANVWLNGTLISDEKHIQGSYGVWNFDITESLKEGKNILAVEIIPPVFGVDVHMGFVDWNPTPPDRSMGIYRDVVLSHTGPVSMRHSNVVTKVDKETLKSAEITISTVLTNHTNIPQKALFEAGFDDLVISKEFDLNANESIEVFLYPSEFTELKMKNPKLWWPSNMGEQNLYDLTLDVSINEIESDTDSFRFGIREIEDFWNDAGYRGFMVNGEEVLLKSAGWVDDIFLGDSDEKVKSMVEYAKHMNLNSLRLEGFWGNNRIIMDMADELGLLLMYGWSAHWEWETYLGIPHDDYVTIRGEEAEIIHSNNYRDQVLWRRRHPSVAIWTYGSDKLPRPSLEMRLNKIMAEIDTTRPILSYCGGSMLMGADDPRQSEISGPTGVKMEGPYDWVPPIYWYIDKQFGGAFGFNTEVGPGPQIPPIQSIKKMIPDESLWPLDSVWLYYSGRGEFKNLDRYMNAFNTRYGESNDLETFLLKNQMSNYESIRPMFEAFAVNKFHSTGVVQWMYNSAWPTLYWQLFDYYLLPNGAFYGTKKGSSPVLPIYDYGDHSIHVNNDRVLAISDMNLHVKIFDIHSKLLYADNLKVSIGNNQSIKVMDMPKLDNLSSSYFLDLRLTDNNNNLIENNFYWLSTKADIPDFENSTWYITPSKQHADFTELNDMRKAKIEYDYSISKESDNLEIDINVHNPSDNIAFFIEFMVVDEITGEPVVPVFLQDNYISLLPGEKRTIRGNMESSHLFNTDNLGVIMQGFNVE